MCEHYVTYAKSKAGDRGDSKFCDREGESAKTGPCAKATTRGASSRYLEWGLGDFDLTDN